MAVATRGGVGKYRVLVGKHSERGVLYIAGENDTIDSKSDLSKMNGGSPSTMKFEFLGPGKYTDTEREPTDYRPGPDDTIDSLTVAELKDLAQEKRVEIPASAKKEEIVALIRANPDGG